MALTRKMLKALGIEDDKIEQIIDAHTETVDALKKERDDWKTKAESIDTTEDWKQKYQSEHSEYETFKKQQRAKDERAAKEAAMRAVYKDAGIADKYIPALLRIADYDKITLGSDGKAINHAALVETAKLENVDFIPTTTIKGSSPATPPASGKVKMTKEQIFAIKDAGERQKAIAENLDVLGY